MKAKPGRLVYGAPDAGVGLSRHHTSAELAVGPGNFDLARHGGSVLGSTDLLELECTTQKRTRLQPNRSRQTSAPQIEGQLAARTTTSRRAACNTALIGARR
jgi:hypothetical protein